VDDAPEVGARSLEADAGRMHMKIELLVLGIVVLIGWGLQIGGGRKDGAVHGAAPEKQKITTFLWFDRNAEEAVRFYVSTFRDSKVLSEARYGEGAPMPAGTLMTSRFQLAGQEFMALNGGPMFRFTEAISLFVSCETQAEIDDLWEKLSAGGEPGPCGWLKDKYGLSWQVVPVALGGMLQDKDPEKAKRVLAAMQGMKKLDIAKLKEAYEQR
jgi:predicted 3-demethylubiquinone-9 3-methyltransferase (glyoxalase superfamily)